MFLRNRALLFNVFINPLDDGIKSTLTNSVVSCMPHKGEPFMGSGQAGSMGEQEVYDV